MKKLLFSFIAVLLPLMASAQATQDVVIDGIYYTLVLKGTTVGSGNEEPEGQGSGNNDENLHGL